MSLVQMLQQLSRFYFHPAIRWQQVEPYYDRYYCSDQLFNHTYKFYWIRGSEGSNM